MGNTIKLAEKTNNGFMYTTKEALNDALDSVGVENKGAFTNGKKVLVLALDDTEGNFSVSFIQGGMKMSECVSLCEVAKTIFLSNMGYIPE